MTIRPFAEGDTDEVIALWHACGLTRPWNDPHRDVARKLGVQRELFLVDVDEDGSIAGSLMAGFDGHRGWVNYLAVAPSARRTGRGRALMQAAERALFELGCPKVNLQVRAGNTEAIGFYRALGYDLDDVVSMGRRLISDP
jgi:ribosomal protein S18 acetylase RimI-like enzyme